MTIGVGLHGPRYVLDVLVVSVRQCSWAIESTAQEVCEQLELQTSCSPENWHLIFSALLHIQMLI